MSLKILVLSHRFYPDIGGIEANSEILATGFSQADHEVRLLTWTKSTGDRAFPFQIIRNPSVLRRIKELYWADVVFENNPCFRLAWPGILFKKPTVIALNTWVPVQKNLQGRLKRRWLKRAKQIIAVSHAVRRRSWLGAVVIRNPYNVAEFVRDTAISKTKDFVFLGRLVSDKGAALAVEALHILVEKDRSKNIALSLTVIGDGPERQHLQAMVSDLGLDAQVQFTGSLRGPELANQLNQHRYILVPSVWEEPFGNVVLEGLACGCLPIASNGGGLPDAVGKAGLLFPRGDVAALASCMQTAVEDKTAHKHLHEAAPQHLANHHPDNVTRQYLAVLQQAVKN